jgi:hypothetical protein
MSPQGLIFRADPIGTDKRGKGMAEERWFLVYRGELHSEEQTYETRDSALEVVAELNKETPGFTCLRIPYRMVVCEGCRSHLLDCIHDVNAQHLTQIVWRDCSEHEYWGQNEQTSLIASWIGE